MWKKPNLLEIPFFSDTVKYITINMFYKYGALSTDHPYYCLWIETRGLPAQNCFSSSNSSALTWCEKPIYRILLLKSDYTNSI